MSNRQNIGPELQRQQADLRASGLLAGAHEKWHHPNDYLWLDALPKTFKVGRRQRSDRLTNSEAARLGLTKPANRTRRHGKR